MSRRNEFELALDHHRDRKMIEQLAREILLATVEFQTLSNDNLAFIEAHWGDADNPWWKVTFLVRGVRLYQVYFDGDKPTINYLGVKDPEEPIAAYTLHGHYIPGSGDFSLHTEPREKAPCGGILECPRCKKDVEEYQAYRLEQTKLREQALRDTAIVNLQKEEESVMVAYTAHGYHIPGSGEETPSPEDRAKEVVRKYVDNQQLGNALFDVMLVMFAYVGGGWKAILTTDIPNSQYFELTYFLDEDRIHINVFSKTDEDDVEG